SRYASVDTLWWIIYRMRVLTVFLTYVIVALVLYIGYRAWSQWSASEGFGPCNDCDVYQDRVFQDSDIVAQSPYRWPISGSAVYNQWMFSPGSVQPPNSTDDAEALAAPNISGMNQLT